MVTALSGESGILLTVTQTAAESWAMRANVYVIDLHQLFFNFEMHCIEVCEGSCTSDKQRFLNAIKLHVSSRSELCTNYLFEYQTSGPIVFLFFLHLSGDVSYFASLSA